MAARRGVDTLLGGMSFKSVQLVAGIILITLAIFLLASCGTIWRAQYSNPKFGGAAVEVELPAKTEGLAK